MELRALKQLFRHHWKTIHTLLDKAELLDAEHYHQDPGYSRGSAHMIFVHLLQTDYAWRGAFEGGLRHEPMEASTYPDIAALRAGFIAEEAAWDAVLAGLEAVDGATPITVTWRHGFQYDFYRDDLLNHLMLHGMQHFAELAQLLTERGQSPGDIDLVFLLFE